jgi:hypothetical protein
MLMVNAEAPNMIPTCLKPIKKSLLLLQSLNSMIEEERKCQLFDMELFNPIKVKLNYNEVNRR